MPQAAPLTFQDSLAYAQGLDAADPLASFRSRFHLPLDAKGQPLIYFTGNSLGLQPKGVETAVNQELRDWADLGVEGHFEAKHPWFSYHERFRELAAAPMGAEPGEVVMMNSLTVNLHLMMVSFYRPTPYRYKIVIEHQPFPSDQYAVDSQIRFHGLDPQQALITLTPRTGEAVIRTEDIEALLREQGPSIALVMLGGVNYHTGQAFDMGRITAAAQAQGCLVGFDLAHAAGNLPLRLHEWGVDFAVWCTYKYLNAGPGGVGGCFVHRRHGANPQLPRLAGWWGNDPSLRFSMPRHFVPQAGAEGWQLSNAPILSMAPLKVSLDLFKEAGMESLRKKSEGLTGYLLFLLDQWLPKDAFTILTPRAAEARGCQLSIRTEQANALCRTLKTKGVICDFRAPDIIRVAPVPFYNTFEEVWRFATLLANR